ncbi:MAG: hypothetical protein QXW32_06295 [Nitrososphaerales archaeon]
MSRYFLFTTVTISLLFLMLPLAQVVAQQNQHSFLFSARHTFGIPGGGVAFNTWQGSGLIHDGVAKGSGFHKASYLIRGVWQEYEVSFIFTGGYKFLNQNSLLIDARVVTSTISSFEVGEDFQILLIKGNKPSQGLVAYYIPNYNEAIESGSQAPAVVVIT